MALWLARRPIYIRSV